MNILEKIFLLSVLTVLTSACSRIISGSKELNSYTTVTPEIVSYNELTMNLDSTPVTYTIDISTPEGRLKLKNISLNSAQQPALVECIMKNNCATLFNPQYTHLMQDKQILRVTVYGFPARYKNVDTQKQRGKK